MRIIIKKALAYIGCAITTWAGILLAFVASTDSNVQCLLGAVLLLLLAIVIAGYGNSLKWKGRE